MILQFIFTIIAILMIPVTIHFWNNPVKWVKRLLESKKLNPDIFMVFHVGLCVLFAIIAIFMAVPIIKVWFIN